MFAVKSVARLAVSETVSNVFVELRAHLDLRFFYTAHGEPQNARELGEKLLRLAR